MTQRVTIRILEHVGTQPWAVGAVVTVDADEAQTMIEQGSAEAVSSKPFDRAEKRTGRGALDGRV